MTAALSIGARVRVPAHRVAGAVVTLAGAAPARQIGVELADGSIMTVREADVVVDDAAPAELSPALREAIFDSVDLVVFSRALVRRTEGKLDEECRALNRLARGYLILSGRRI